jgi:threonine dehydrogenase-like Zn-dependent dehydrogenase
VTDTSADSALPRSGRSAIWVANNVIGIQDEPIGAPGPGEILVRIRAAGICGSDLHAFHADAPRQHLPGIGPGHELAGEVAALGPGVKGPPPGTRVAVFAGRTCTTCEFCQVGRLQLCRELRFSGVGYSGGMGDYFVAQEGLVYLVPDGMDWTVAALSEPCAISLHGIKRAGLQPGQRVLVLGAGTIGLFAALVARDAGAGHIGITARYPQQAAAARALGVNEVFDPANVGRGSPAANSGNWDLVIETVGGTAPTFQQAINLATRGGKVLLLGIHQEPQLVTTTRIWREELTIVGAWGYDAGSPTDYDETLALLQKYHDIVRPLVTHTFPLEHASEAFAASVNKQSGAIKVTVLP